MANAVVAMARSSGLIGSALLRPDVPPTTRCSASCAERRRIPPNCTWAPGVPGSMPTR